jgi:short-subunit dehydrogenase
VVQQMVERKSGRIILLSSLAGRVVVPFLGPYNMTKFAIEAMGDSLRLELAPHGIQVSLIEPGLIFTGFNERMAASKYEWLKPTSVIAKHLDILRKHDANLEKASYTTESVVSGIVHAVTATRPKIRYITPKNYALPINLLRLMPDRLKDKSIRQNAGI